MISHLRQKRFFTQLSIYDVSRMTGIDPGRLSLIERWYKTPRNDEKQKIAKALSCELDEIFPEGEEVQNPTPLKTGKV